MSTSAANQILTCQGQLKVDIGVSQNAPSQGAVKFVGKVINTETEFAAMKVYGSSGFGFLLLEALNSKLQQGFAIRTNAIQGGSEVSGGGEPYIFRAYNEVVEMKNVLITNLKSSANQQTGQTILTVNRSSTEDSSTIFFSHALALTQGAYKAGEGLFLGVGGSNIYAYYGMTSPTGSASSSSNRGSLGMKIGNAYTESISFASDQSVNMPGTLTVNTINATNYIGFPTFNPLPITLDQTNNRVGINSTTPTEALDVVGNAKVSGTMTADTVSATTYIGLPPVVVPASELLPISLDKVNNRVGINNTTPTSALDITGNLSLTGRMATTSTSISIGSNAGSSLSTNSVAIGNSAGQISQGANSIAIGIVAANNTQGSNSVAIGNGAGQTTQGALCVALGYQCGKTNQGTYSVSIGIAAGNNSQGTNSVAIGNTAGYNVQGSSSVAIGNQAGYSSQSATCVAIGANAGQTVQGTSSVAIGYGAGFNQQSSTAVSIGSNAGYTFQGANSVAIGIGAGYSSQGQASVAIGNNAGTTTQAASSIAIGNGAGNSSQAGNSVAIGLSAGQTSQSTQAIAIGSSAGQNTQSVNGVAIGAEAGRFTQGINSVSIGTLAGNNLQGTNSVAVGAAAGNSNQSIQAVAVGGYAGQTTQGSNTVAIGYVAGNDTQGANSVAVGAAAGNLNQSANSVAIGLYAGQISQGSNCVAVGNSAGQTNQHANSIILNATGSALNSDGTSRTYVAPVREVANNKTVQYNATTKEVTYTDTLVTTGTGSPEGAITAPVGRLFLRTNGDAETTMYVKISGTGNTGWAPVRTNSTPPSWSIVRGITGMTPVPFGTITGYTDDIVPPNQCTVNKAAGTVTITVPGRYYISFFGFTMGDVNQYAQVSVMINNVFVNRNYAYIAGWHNMNNSVGGIYDLNVNDVVTISWTGTAPFYPENNCTFSGYQIR